MKKSTTKIFQCITLNAKKKEDNSHNTLGHTKSGKPIHEGKIYHLKSKGSESHPSMIGRARKGEHTDIEFHSGKRVSGIASDYIEENYELKEASASQQKKWHDREAKHSSPKDEDKHAVISKLADREDFYDKVAEHIGLPDDDGESEHALHERIAKHPNYKKFVDSFKG